MKKYLLLSVMLLIVAIYVAIAQTAVQPLGSGTESDPYQIATLDNLYWLSQADTAWDKHFIQTADIDAATTSTWDSDDNGGYSGFSPIGRNEYKWFSGSYDGQGHTIDNLYINRPTTDYVALFGYVTKEATIANIRLTNINFTGQAETAGLIGSAYTSEIYNCSTTGNIVANGANSGGLIGKLSSSTVNNCYAIVNIQSSYSTVGGFVGFMYNKSVIKNSYSRGKCEGDASVGGFIGYSYTSYTYNCYSSTVVTGNSKVGGFLGSYYSSSEEDCFWDKEISGQTTTAGNATGKTTAEMKNIATYTNLSTAGLNNAWDFIYFYNDDENNNDYWAFGPGNDGYPVFMWQDSIYSYVEAQKITDNSATEATLECNIIFLNSFNQISHGICWNTTESPTTNDSKTDEGAATGDGAFSSTLIGLTDGTTYFVRPYITDEFGTHYGQEFTFTAGNASVTTDSIIIDENHFTAYGNLLTFGSSSVTNYGFCWSQLPNPTPSDSVVDYGSATNTGQFSNTTTGLTPGLTYYIRAFATNSSGTVYGKEFELLAVTKPTGSGTETNPYQIASIGNLYWICNNINEWDKYYVQTADIDASSSTQINNSKGFFPIGNNNTYFTGSYDGQNHTIKNLFINRPNTNYIGLFGIMYGNLKNLGITNVTIKGYDYTGSLIGNLIHGNINSCFVSGGSVTGRSNTGGLVGYLNYSTATNSYANVHVEIFGGIYEFGGLIGSAWHSTVSKCYSAGSLSTSGSPEGLIGKQDYSDIIDSFWDTQKSGITHSNGGTGKTTIEMQSIKTFTNKETEGIDESWDLILNFFDDKNSNDIWAFRGGINDGLPAFVWQDSILALCSTDSIDNITSTTATIKANILFLSSETPTSYGICWNTTGNPSTADNIIDKGTPSGTGVYTAEMTGLTNNTTYYVKAFVTNKFGTYYGKEIELRTGKPFVYIDSVINVSGTNFTAYGNIISIGNSALTSHGFCWNYSGSPTVNDFKNDAGSTADRGAFNLSLTIPYGMKYYIKAYAINSTDTSYSEEIEVSLIPEPEGDGSKTNPYKIANLGNLRWLSENYKIYDKGFYFIQTADINAQNTRFWNINGNDTLGFHPIGEYDLRFNGSYDGQGHIIDSLYCNNATSRNALFAYLEQANISNLGVTNADITGVSGAILSAYTKNTTIENCFTTGKVECSGSNAGGISGILRYTCKIKNCYNTATINADKYAGGIVGLIMESTSTIENCYSTGKINCSDNAGGICGAGTCTTISTLWDTETSGQATSSIGEGYTSARMKNMCTFVSCNNWDFANETANGSDDIWSMNPSVNNGYPFFTYQGYSNNPNCDELTISGLSVDDKIYDGTTDAVISGTAVINGVQGSDDVSLTSNSVKATFIDKNVGTDKEVIVSGYEITGNDACYYSLNQSSNLQADITPKTVTVTDIAVEDKTYDGTTEATVTGSTLNNVISGDDVSLIMTSAVFANKDAGTDIPVNVILSLSGNDTANYTLQSLTGLSANINKAVLTITAKDTTREVGESNPDFELLFDGFVHSEDTSVIDELPQISCDADENSTTGEYIITLSGGDDNNYNLILNNGTLTVTDTNSTAITSNKAVSISIYPNPAESDFILTTKGSNIKTVEILNTLGEVIMQPTLNNLSTHCVSVNISDLQQGIYLIKVITQNDNIQIIRLMKK